MVLDFFIPDMLPCVILGTGATLALI